MTRLAAALALALMGALVVFGSAAAQNTPASITIPINPQNSSGESGTATLTTNADQTTTVVVNLTGAPSNPQPAHIHPGTCANLDPNPKYPLTSVQNGQSTTTVPVSLESLINGGFAINVHKSAQEVSVYYACGDITLAGAQLAPQTGHAQGAATLPATGLVLLASGLLGAGILLRRRLVA
ncbi:MAG TPA: CHRD domain-containing protein [Thermomicrobiaceae bacterium]|nr:CHRD domain-containing protein [Thermomicrobiaceae bacterium]